MAARQAAERDARATEKDADKDALTAASRPAEPRPGDKGAQPAATRPERVSVRVPATSANVGVGFDVLGVSLELFANFSFSPAPELRILGCDERFRGPDNLVWTSYLQACRELGATARPLEIVIDSPIPASGGMGSSSACVVAGIVAAQLLSGHGYDADEALDVATRIEGHPDNVAPAIKGTLVSSFVDEDGSVCALRWTVAPNLRFVCMAPPYRVLTSEARKVIPRTVPTQTAIWQVGRCVAMVQALERGDAALISRCCHDRLHEPYRAELIADYGRLREASYAAGACGFVISGSGATMLAIADGDEVASRVAAAAEKAVEGLWVRVLRADSRGTTYEVGDGTGADAAAATGARTAEVTDAAGKRAATEDTARSARSSR